MAVGTSKTINPLSETPGLDDRTCCGQCVFFRFGVLVMHKLLPLMSALLLVPTSAPAAPLDSPGTVYIDGLPCNLACQAYMAWSRQLLSQPVPITQKSVNSDTKSKAQESSRAKVAPKSSRIAKRTAPALAPMPTAGAAPTATNGAPPGSHPSDTGDITSSSLATAKAGQDIPSENEKVLSPSAIAETATVPAEEPAKESANKATANKNDQPMSSTEPQGYSDNYVAILLVQPEIKTVSDLRNNIIAIDDTPSNYSVEEVRSAIVAAAGVDIQMSEESKMAVIRVVDGDVRAAVVTILNETAAEAWRAKFPGFNVFRISLPPAAEKAKRG
ncbi:MULTISPECIES: hypothetical protein [unclassified Bradyrhizobium]|uniref:hypothetical protein n=1 Tax=unclassified Bradyrhizobium TaxID=2631580 RepID=UPI00040AEE0B|nr:MULTISPECIES: hypothetical protein [unclassified Bradyrhizobium]QIG97316.1 hypothetical protein G6P99_36310 [Bradyrhizobium sp. 6(2017)]